MSELHAAAEAAKRSIERTNYTVRKYDLIRMDAVPAKEYQDLRTCRDVLLALLNDPTPLLKRPEWHEWKCGDCQWSTGGNGTYHAVKSEDGHWRAYLYFGTVMGVRECCESKEAAQAACWADYCERMRGAFISQK